jgi:hypothetical protein
MNDDNGRGGDHLVGDCGDIHELSSDHDNDNVPNGCCVKHASRPCSCCCWECLYAPRRVDGNINKEEEEEEEEKEELYHEKINVDLFFFAQPLLSYVISLIDKPGHLAVIEHLR